MIAMPYDRERESHGRHERVLRSERRTEWGRLRRMPGDRGRLVVPPSALCQVRAHRLLRLVARAARQPSRGGCRAPHHPQLQAGRGMVLGLHPGAVRPRSRARAAAPPPAEPARPRTGRPRAPQLGRAPALTAGALYSNAGAGRRVIRRPSGRTGGRTGGQAAFGWVAGAPISFQADCQAPPWATFRLMLRKARPSSWRARLRGPTSIGCRPTEATSSRTRALAAASSPATKPSRSSSVPVGSSCFEANRVLNALTTWAPGRSLARSSALELVVSISGPAAP